MTVKQNIRLAIITTHPIQYYAPVFMLLSKKTELMVFYTKDKIIDKGFQRKIVWDIPLLEGYEYLFAGRGLLQKVKEFKPQSILIYGWAHISHFMIMKYFKGRIPIIFRGDSTLLAEQSFMRNIVRQLALSFIYKHVSKALYVGKNNKAYFRRYGLKKTQLAFAPHAVDNERFAKPVKSDIRNNLKLEPNDVLILYAGKFEPIKNPDLLLQAFIQLHLPNTYLLFTGDGVLKDRLQAMSNLHEKVHFLPFQNQSQMPAVYQACDLFCLPSNNDSWGLAVNEAMAASKAILVSDKVGAAADLVRSENGKIFRHNDLEDLKKNLLDLVTDIPGLKRKGKASSKIINDWTFEIQAQNVLDAISK